MTGILLRAKACHPCFEIPDELAQGQTKRVFSKSSEGEVIGTRERMMRLALDEAGHALHLGEVPIGAVLARDQDVVASGFNQPIHAVDPTAHAEVVALRKAARELGNYRLPGLTLYVTVEPCMMCIGAIVQARIGELVYGAAEPKFGAVESIIDLSHIGMTHRLSVVSGVLEQDCKKILQEFFSYRRDPD